MFFSKASEVGNTIISNFMNLGITTFYLIGANLLMPLLIPIFFNQRTSGEIVARVLLAMLVFPFSLLILMLLPLLFIDSVNKGIFTIIEKAEDYYFDR